MKQVFESCKGHNPRPAPTRNTPRRKNSAPHQTFMKYPPLRYATHQRAELYSLHGHARNLPSKRKEQARRKAVGREGLPQTIQTPKEPSAFGKVSLRSPPHAPPPRAKPAPPESLHPDRGVRLHALLRIVEGRQLRRDNLVETCRSRGLLAQPVAQAAAVACLVRLVRMRIDRCAADPRVAFQTPVSAQPFAVRKRSVFPDPGMSADSRRGRQADRRLAKAMAHALVLRLLRSCVNRND